jgi:AcrR family transcriptional regulator
MTKQKTSKARMALIEAFKRLVVSRRYEEFYIADIIAAADVSRSSFYEHFHSKQDLLQECLQGVIEPLSAVGFAGEIEFEHVVGLLDHFQEVGEISLAFLKSDVSQIFVQMLSHAIAQKLARQASTTTIPHRLAAAQIAESTLGLLREWLSHFAETRSQDVARQLLDSSRLLTAAALSQQGPEH